MKKKARDGISCRHARTEVVSGMNEEVAARAIKQTSC
jgi:hypothetical protein